MKIIYYMKFYGKVSISGIMVERHEPGTRYHACNKAKVNWTILSTLPTLHQTPQY